MPTSFTFHPFPANVVQILGTSGLFLYFFTTLVEKFTKVGGLAMHKTIVLRIHVCDSD